MWSKVTCARILPKFSRLSPTSERLLIHRLLLALPDHLGGRFIGNYSESSCRRSLAATHTVQTSSSASDSRFFIFLYIPMGSRILWQIPDLFFWDDQATSNIGPIFGFFYNTSAPLPAKPNLQALFTGSCVQIFQQENFLQIACWSTSAGVLSFRQQPPSMKRHWAIIQRRLYHLFLIESHAFT